MLVSDANSNNSPFFCQQKIAEKSKIKNFTFWNALLDLGLL
ncbi:hypothetical protein VCRA2119O147_1620008 [Vibrio crassostreae]|nr:hypothetical protein VCRA2110O173_140011 [Vibrio crassostreae]CAK1832048.1 hypothetical protein VCRA2113O222_10191 [Vibrio crassostreae]CAK1832840.1 hypothetical protein VCRA2119O245_10193 [Vibrio crassostreae]CAK1843143.1 hypothetical protein VCRA2113O213_10189 [Vibrio crassostreae]CAK1847358.1 hypothetical protein VCRA2112O192_10191 [Vibrio crassostreae]